MKPNELGVSASNSRATLPGGVCCVLGESFVRPFLQVPTVCSMIISQLIPKVVLLAQGAYMEDLEQRTLI